VRDSRTGWESVRATPRAFIGKVLIVDLEMHQRIRKPDRMAHQLKYRKATDDDHKGAKGLRAVVNLTGGIPREEAESADMNAMEQEERR
jgi:hypothetical protein